MDFYANFHNVSTTIHILSGFAFLCLGVSETISIQNAAHKFKKYLPVIFFITGFISFISLLYYNGFVLKNIKDNFATIPSLYILNALSFIFMSYGVSMLVEILTNSLLWKITTRFFSFSIVFLYLFFSYRTDIDIRKENLIIHLGIAIPLFIAFILKAMDFKLDVKKAGKITAILFFIAAFELITYKEIEKKLPEQSKPAVTQRNLPEKGKDEIENTPKKSSTDRPVHKSKK